MNKGFALTNGCQSPTVRLCAAGVGNSILRVSTPTVPYASTRQKSVPTLIKADRELLVEFHFVVGSVEPNVGTVDAAENQQSVQILERGARRELQSGSNMPHAIGGRPSHVPTHGHDGTRNGRLRPSKARPATTLLSKSH